MANPILRQYKLEDLQQQEAGAEMIVEEFQLDSAPLERFSKIIDERLEMLEARHSSFVTRNSLKRALGR